MLNLKSRRKELKITQIEMASWLGISRVALQNIENGAIPSGYHLEFMSYYYQIPIEQLSLEYQKMRALRFKEKKKHLYNE
ncbi:MAG: helix-turn-helix transcriptional regulator [Candidatus Cloacimonetes bacterium]|nr:helix-turn-helix transcriptional regulator [Candidatus Cloacimonadota bacterium]